ncbi:ead/Ea22-like family protein [Pseudomonas mosselii]|uniref:ead/Ea22-like family protein n=1 Tax=Pseudomonas mosselii TaxID=78327 RepID=UPI0021DB47B0|nr:ead/Ea22-like family protein [Pseudomonas mosselii]MCU9528757.1 ead/Ea22-like family protein [Pseudomonas mosselii]MCU9536092.1 ead/Ea22-like family protein [Pseudomonas mosselii]MCU9541727.1 ead/Ea22-like family protein [Pseudomonas mosselii]MCU9547686.1 ead/Ea22-like family protein [Pseudomonas mosselii]
MTIDKQKLKALAEAATQGDWNLHERRLGAVVYGGPIQHWVNGSGQSQIAMMTGADWMRDGESEANAEFIAAANPATVLALLAEIERLERKNANQAESIRQYQDHLVGGDSILSLTNERDELKVENEELRGKYEILLEAAGNMLRFSKPTCMNDEKWRDRVAAMAKEASHG